MQLHSQIEALLFWKGEPISKRELTRIFGVNLVAINDALADLRKTLEGHGIALVETGNDIALAASDAASALIEQLRKEEMAVPLSRAALETLSIILYKRGVSRREIEYIRGVNSTSILRTLLIRGLISREEREREGRFSYEPTVDLLALLGLSKIEDLPEFETVAKELAEFEPEEKEEENERKSKKTC